MCIQMRDTLGPLDEDGQFAALLSSTGQPAEAPARLALVLVLQCTEGLADRQAADAGRGRIDGKMRWPWSSPILDLRRRS
jgi:hypothetical protein